MPILSRHDSILAMLSVEQRSSLLGVQTTLAADPLFLEHIKESNNEERLQGIPSLEDGNAKGASRVSK